MIVPSRRRFLIAAAATLAMPAIVRASSLMPVRRPTLTVTIDFDPDTVNRVFAKLESVFSTSFLQAAASAGEELRNEIRAGFGRQAALYAATARRSILREAAMAAAAPGVAWQDGPAYIDPVKGGCDA